MSLKRIGEDTSDGPSSAAKVPRLSYQIVLDEESEQPTDEDEESVHSMQGKETDWAQDTSDTTTHSDWSGDVAVDVEYEVASLPEKENPLGDGSLSSDTDGIVCAAGMVVLCDDELSLLADTSGNSDSPQTIDPEVPRADYWTCVQCKNKNNNPLFRYCEKCYKVRKNFFPPRPHRKKRKRRASCSHKKESSVVKSLSTAPVDTLSDIHVDSGLGSSQGSSLVIDSKCETDSQEASIVSGSGDSDLCVTCMIYMEKMSKKLINLPENCVDEMLDGLVRAHPGLCLHADKRVILTKQWADSKNRVALLSGGGSGHEPFAGGFVGSGMLSGAVAGSVFASPPPRNILHAIRCVAQGNEAGTLVFIPNYTGDCLNFGLAVEWAKSEGLKVESIVLGEDCALLGQDSSVGRRGMCGMVFIFKIAGAMAEKGKSLMDISQTVRMVMKVLATYGVSLSACSLPGSGPLFKIGPDEMELGLGVHGEAGIKRVKMCTAAETVKIILEAIIGTLKLKSEDEIVVFVNNLGGTSQLEQWLVTGEVHKQFTALGIAVLRIYAACIMTSLEMAGIQVSALKVSVAHKEDWLNYLDAESKACAWFGSPMSVPPANPVKDIAPPGSVPVEFELKGPAISDAGCKILRRCLEAVALSFISNESQLNELDSACGDGDTGTTLRRMADGILLHLGTLTMSHPSTLLKQLSSIAETAMGGTSGALYSLMLTMAGMALEAEVEAVTARTWATALMAGTNGTLHYSQAKLGDRSMFDALLPACMKFDCYKLLTLEDGLTALEAAVVAAEEGCQKTCSMKARVGRAAYVDATHVTDVDAGAYAVTVWLKAIFSELKTCY